MFADYWLGIWKGEMWGIKWVSNEMGREDASMLLYGASLPFRPSPLYIISAHAYGQVGVAPYAGNVLHRGHLPPLVMPHDPVLVILVQIQVVRGPKLQGWARIKADLRGGRCDPIRQCAIRVLPNGSNLASTTRQPPAPCRSSSLDWLAP